MPAVGNHEYSDGENLVRYRNSTWQGWGPASGGDVPGEMSETFKETKQTKQTKQTKVTAAAARMPKVEFHGSSSLGHFISAGNHHSAGSRGANGHPSNSSRYFSSQLGLVHMVVLDFNLYYNLDPCGDFCRQAQLDWFEEDLRRANANRGAVPWLLVTTPGVDGTVKKLKLILIWYIFFER
jgi:hypothetical protein